MFYSQAGQDKWILEASNKKDGFFVDVGAHNGVGSSNTYFLENIGWKGICIEPGDSFEDLQTNRKSLNLNFAVTDYTGTIGFFGDRVDPNGRFVQCSTLLNLLNRCNAPRKIDYLSIDVEGHELNVLRGMDFDYYHVNRITIEHNKYLEGEERKNKIYDYLTKCGFKRVREDVQCQDALFLGVPYEDWYENIICH